MTALDKFLNVTKITSKVKPIIWQDNIGVTSTLHILDQRLLPYEKKYLELTSYKQVIDSIKNMAVRGAPLIGIVGAYAMALAAYEFVGTYRGKPLIEKLQVAAKEIKSARPTAVNLKWAVDLILNDLRHGSNDITDIITKRAVWIHEDDVERCRKIGENGLAVIPGNDISILTICNTGSLATGGIGTAFGVILTAHKNNIPLKVFAAETRPRQQGARLTTFECAENGIDYTLISDTACGYLMQKGEIDLVIVGADRIASNGDSANKIGTYQLAVLAGENNVPFYIAAPLSTFDLSITSGDKIPIEERNPEEIININDKPICVSGTKVRNPAFDVTPAKYISGIITEKGILSENYLKSIRKIFNKVTLV